MSKIWLGRRGSREKNYRQMYGKLKINWASFSPATSFKFGEYNKLPSMVKLRFISYAKSIFQQKLFAIWFPYKHGNFWLLCLPSKMALLQVQQLQLGPSEAIVEFSGVLNQSQHKFESKVCWDLIWPFLLENRQCKPLEQIILIDSYV